MKFKKLFSSLAVLALLVTACQKDDNRYQKINSSSRVHLASGNELEGGIRQLNERHSMNFKSNVSYDYVYEAAATPPALDYGQTSATSIIRRGRFVYIGWHTPDAANANPARYSGGISCYRLIASGWRLEGRLDFTEMDIHEIAFGGANELFLVGQANPDNSGYDLTNGHRGAIVGRVSLDANGIPTTSGYIERPLVSFGANSICYVSPNEIYVGTGNAGGYLYKMDNNLSVSDSTYMDNVKSINYNTASNKIGLLKGNRSESNVSTKHYEWPVGGALPQITAGQIVNNLNTVLNDRNEGTYYQDLYLATGEEGLISFDPATGSASNVYNSNFALSTASDELNELVYVAAAQNGLRALSGPNTANPFETLGSFAPPSINNGNWYVSDVVHDNNSVFITSGPGDVIFVKEANCDLVRLCNNLSFTCYNFPETSNIEDSVTKYFGPDYVVADWNDLVTLGSADRAQFASCMELDRKSFLIKRNGQRFFGSRHYYVDYHEGGIPYPSFLVHASLDNDYWLGSWFGINMSVMVKYDPSSNIPNNFAYYPFNGNTADASGNGRNATNNGATLTTDRYGNANAAYEFDGVNDYIAAPAINQNTDFSFSVWVNSDIDNPGVSKSILMERDQFGGDACGPNSSGNFEVNLDENRKLRFGIATIDGACELKKMSGPNVASKNTWYHFAGTYSKASGEIKIYIDGNYISTLAVNQNLRTTTNPILWIGRNDASNQYWDGKIDDLRIFNVTLDDTQVSSIYNLEKP